ncbi:MAG TPA: hypothetical protein VGJ79_02870 [Candidatus Dormibacteraeota bacterium]
MSVRLLVAALMTVVLSACGGASTVMATPTPVDMAVVKFKVGDESFRVKLTTKAQVDAARAAKAGGSARIPNGSIVTGAEVNSGWSWHLVNVAFAEATTEVCDGRPSDVEQAGVNFGGGRYCPWTAEIVSIEAA